MFYCLSPEVIATADRMANECLDYWDLPALVGVDSPYMLYAYYDGRYGMQVWLVDTHYDVDMDAATKIQLIKAYTYHA